MVIMAENKKSFIAYADWKETFDNLPDEVAGKLIKHIFSYVNDENPQTDDYVINAVFANIKHTLKRDLDKWESQLEQRKLAGKRSAEIRATKINDRSNSLNEKTRNSTDSVSVSVNDNVSVNDSVINNIKKTPRTNKFVPPTVFDVKEYFILNGYTSDSGEKAFNYYDVANWKDSTGKQVNNWKQKMQSVWFKEENKIKDKLKERIPSNVYRGEDGKLRMKTPF
jgi:hypothetical protein